MLYKQELIKSGFSNFTYKDIKLKACLQKHKSNGLIAFAKIQTKGCVFQNLVDNTYTAVSDAVAHSYKLASRDPLEDATKMLWSEIQQEF